MGPRRPAGLRSSNRESRQPLAPPDTPTRRTRIIVVTTSTGEAAGIIVDSVRSVMRVSRESIRPAAGSESGAIESLCACEDEFVSVVELDEVLSIDA